MRPEDEIAYCDRRLPAVTSGKAKMERLIATRPNDHRAEVWKQRLVEYENSIAGLPLRRRLAVLALQKKRGAKPGDHDITPPAVGHGE